MSDQLQAVIAIQAITLLVLVTIAVAIASLLKQIRDELRRRR